MKNQIRLTTFLMLVMTIVAGCTKPDNPNNGDNNGNGGGNSGNGGGGNETIELPTVITNEVTEITEAEAIGGGNVESDGGATVTERGICWDTEQMPTINGKHASSGTGTGNFTCELTELNPTTTYYVRAYATNSKGTCYGNEVSFITKDIPYYPTGAINGLFSVSSGKKVYFSQGNLIYESSTNTFRFADNQYDNSSIFGWATSGWNGYRPDLVSNNDNDYFSSGDMTGIYANADWGIYNAITNGGNTPGLWRTPKYTEWDYVFEKRSASTINGVRNARFAKGRIGSRYGVILFPDDYSHPNGVSLPVGINDTGETGWKRNQYNITEWKKMEKAGAVFLPANGNSNSVINTAGHYWSANRYLVTGISWIWAYEILFSNEVLLPKNTTFRYTRSNVRLIQDAD